MTGRAVRRLAFAGLLAFALPGGRVEADYQDSFRQGILQYRAQNWNGTVALMRAAIAERANEDGRVRITGNDSLPYLPSFYLGDALMRLGDCPGAMAAFERARQTAAANNRQWTTRMDDVRDSCARAAAADRNAEAAKRTAEAGTAIQAAAAAVAEARAARERIDRYREREFGGEALGAFNSELAAATGALANADLRLGQAKQGSDAQAAREIERQARAVTKEMSALESRLQDQIRRLADAAAAKVTPVKPPPATSGEPAKDPGPGGAANTSSEQLQRLQNAVRLASTALRSAQQAEASYEASRGNTVDTPPIQQARTDLNAIAETVNRGTRASAAELAAAASSATRVRDVFSRARDAALSRDLTEAAQAIERLLISAAGSLETLERLARPAPGRRAAMDAQVLTPHQRELARLRAGLGGSAARDPGTLRRTLGGATTLDQTLSDLVATYGRQVTAASGVPADLLEGARTYFAGRYADAASQLGAVDLPADTPQAVRLQMHLLRAAAAYAAWALDGERDEIRRQMAARDVAECRRIDPAFTPDPAVFSPRFIRFFRQ